MRATPLLGAPMSTMACESPLPSRAALPMESLNFTTSRVLLAATRWLSQPVSIQSNTCGHETFPRDWALGETIAVGQGKFTEGSITGFRHLIYLCPSDGGWTIHDLAILTEPDDNLRSYSLGAAIIAADALMKKKVARSDP